MIADKKETFLPCYVPYGTFRNYIESFREHGLPSRIDRSTMPGMAGGTQSHLTSSLKFLGLIGPDGEPSPAMEKLVDGVTSGEWTDPLADIITRQYSPIIGGIDLTRATTGQVTEAFRKSGLEGSTLDKALRFYLQALKDAAIVHSPHLANMKPKNATRKPSNKSSAPKGNGSTVAEDTPHVPPAPPKGEDESTPKGMISFPIHIRGKLTGKIVVPEDISAADCAMVEVALQAVKIYAGPA